MKNSVVVITSLFVAFCLTGAAAAVTILCLAFSQESDEFSVTGLFDSVYVSSTALPNGNLDLSFGIANGLPLFLIFLVVFAFTLLVVFFFGRLSSYQKELKAERG